MRGAWFLSMTIRQASRIPVHARELILSVQGSASGLLRSGAF